MLPNPLHPALVHFPIVLVMLLPIAAAVALWTIHRGTRPTRAWLVPLAFAAALSASAWLAVETGEQQEEKVEDVVGEAAMDTHAEGAERFLFLSLGVDGASGLGAGPRAGRRGGPRDGSGRGSRAGRSRLPGRSQRWQAGL